MKNINLFRMDLSSVPSDVICCISKHLTNFSLLEDIKFKRKDIYLLFFFFGQNMPKDANEYNEYMEDENKYYGRYDFTHHFKQDLTCFLRMIKQKYKQIHPKTYEISFDDKEHKRWKNKISLFKFILYDNNNKKCLVFCKEGLATITYKDTAECTYLLPYEKLNFSNKDKHDIKTIMNNIENDIKYYIKQCFTYQRLKIIFPPPSSIHDDFDF
jgi:hypothetical protein